MTTRLEHVITKYLPLFQADFNCSLDDAVAVFGNLAHECNGFATLQEVKPLVAGSRGGFGWAQWTGPRRREYEAYCARHDFDPAADDSNYRFLFVELKLKGYGFAVDRLKRETTLLQKVIAFEGAFLRAGIKHYDSRFAWAQKVRAIALRTAPAAQPVQKEEKTMDNLQGFKTVFVGLLMAILPALTQYLGMVDWNAVLPFPFNFMASGIVMIIMRFLTTSPIFKKG